MASAGLSGAELFVPLQDRIERSHRDPYSIQCPRRKVGLLCEIDSEPVDIASAIRSTTKVEDGERIAGR